MLECFEMVRLKIHTQKNTRKHHKVVIVSSFSFIFHGFIVLPNFSNTGTLGRSNFFLSPVKVRVIESQRFASMYGAYFK